MSGWPCSVLQCFESLVSESTEADDQVSLVLGDDSMGQRELEQSSLEVQGRRSVGTREKHSVSTETGASAGLTARIVASTSLMCLLGGRAGAVGSSSLRQQLGVTLEGGLDCPASENSAKKPCCLPPSYARRAVRDEALLDA